MLWDGEVGPNTRLDKHEVAADLPHCLPSSLLKGSCSFFTGNVRKSAHVRINLITLPPGTGAKAASCSLLFSSRIVHFS